jgi:DNA-binding SARP family transcriptional activator
MTQLLIQTFGGFEAHLRGSATALPFRTRKGIALTAYLAVRHNGPTSREELAELLWGGVPPEQSRHSVRQALLDIRRTLGPQASGYLAATNDTARFDAARLRVDVHRFEQALEGKSVRANALACALYRGDFLAGLHIREPTFDHWLLNERNRLKQLAADAFQQRIEFLTDAGDTARGLQAGLRLLDLDPFHEWGHRAVIALYARRGQLGAARRHYETFAKHLKSELDVDPEPETQDLLRRLLRERGARA